MRKPSSRRLALRVSLSILLALTSVLVSYAAVELPDGLAQRVERLIAEVERAPSNEQNLVERTEVLWDWANFLSMEGVYIPKRLPLLVARSDAPRPGTSAAGYAPLIDTFVRHLAHRQGDELAFGEATVMPRTPLPVDSFQTLTTTLTVGTLGIAEGGGIVASQHIGSATGRFQTEDPAGSHYLTLEADRRGTRFERTDVPVVGVYGGFRGAVGFPKWIVRGAPLEPGDTVTITYGDRSGGGPGVQIGASSNDGVPLPLFVDPGDGFDYELRAPTFSVEGGPVSGVHGFAPSIVGVGERFEVSVRSEDHYYNRAVGATPAYHVTVNGDPWGEIEGDGKAIHLLEASFDRPGVYRFAFRSADGRVRGVANPVWVRSDPQQRLYWGETHGHSGFAEGVGTPEGFYRFAWEDARLDFATLSEHDIWLSDFEWKILNDVSADFRAKTDLITYPGYEWTTDRARGGHHNVIFRRIGMKRIHTQMAPNLSELFHHLANTHPAEDVLTIPHAHQAGDWRLSDLKAERLIELMSGHGTFEFFGQRYLENGWRVGFIGASDDHLGHPGYSPGGQSRRSKVYGNIFQFGGLAGVYAPERSADAIFAAMRARSAYATSGAQRIILDATLSGEPMGTEVAEAEGQERRRVIEGRVIGTAPIHSIDLIKNGDTIASVAGFEPGTVDEEADTVRLVVSFFSDTEIFYRDNPRGHRTWKGTLTAKGAKIKKARLLGTVSRLLDRAEVEDGALSFSVATRGSARTILMTLSDVSPGASLDIALEPSAEGGRAPVVVRPAAQFEAAAFTLAVPVDAEEKRYELAAGRYRDVASVQRADKPRDDIEFRFEDVGDPGDWYYIKAVQADGHRAWSSPWWVGDEPPL